MIEWSRRQFLAAGTAGAAGLAMENKARVLRAPEKPWNQGTGRVTRKFRDPVPTACAGCASHCPLVAYRDGERVVQVAPNPRASTAGKTCARAFQALEALYDPERVLRPLRRVGRRGEGKWEPVSWEEALDRLAGALVQSPDTAYVDAGRLDPLAGALLDRLGVGRRVEHETSRRWAAREAQREIYGLPLGRPDLRRVNTVLLVGARPLDGGPEFTGVARDLVRARAAGALVIAVGSFEGATGSLADQWLPSRPGTDSLVLLGLARILLAQGWYDAEGFRRAVASSPEAILRRLVPYTADLVEAASGIPALQLVQVAQRFAERGPSLCLVDGAGSEQAEALEAAAAVLNCLAGDPEAAGVRLEHTPAWVPRFDPRMPRARAVKDILAGNERASLYLAYRANPVYWSPRSESVRRAFADEGRVELLVALDTHLTETAELADLVLPAAADLELWNLLGGYTPEGKAAAFLQQPATRRPSEPELLRAANVALERLFQGPAPGPLGQARQLGDVLLGAIDRVLPSGHPIRKDFPFPDCGSFVRHLADTTPSLAADGGFERLAREGTWTSRAALYPRVAHGGLPTATGLVEVEGRLSHRVPRELKRLEGDRFALVVLSHPELGHGYANTRWGREIRFRNPVYLHADTARELGVALGDRVVIRTEVGEAVGRAAPIHGIHPRAVAVAEDFGHWAGGVAATARGEPTGEAPRPLLVSRKTFLANPLGATRGWVAGADVPWWQGHGPGISVQALSPFTSDARGAQAWREVSVTVRRA